MKPFLFLDGVLPYVGLIKKEEKLIMKYEFSNFLPNHKPLLNSLSLISTKKKKKVVYQAVSVTQFASLLPEDVNCYGLKFGIFFLIKVQGRGGGNCIQRWTCCYCLDTHKKSIWSCSKIHHKQ